MICLHDGFNNPFRNYKKNNRWCCCQKRPYSLWIISRLSKLRAPQMPCGLCFVQIKLGYPLLYDRPKWWSLDIYPHLQSWHPLCSYVKPQFNCIAKPIIYKKQHIQESVVFTIEYIVGSCNSSHQRISCTLMYVSMYCTYVAMYACT